MGRGGLDLKGLGVGGSGDGGQKNGEGVETDDPKIEGGGDGRPKLVLFFESFCWEY